MNMSVKDVRFLIEATELLLASYKGQLLVSSEGIQPLSEDEEADLGNDIKYLECLLADLNKQLEACNNVYLPQVGDT